MEITSANLSPTPSEICLVCHQPIRQEYYFCPNCGTKLHAPPLSTSVTSQAWLYFLSIILPSLAFLFITKWKGLEYLRAKDEKTRIVGIIACVLLLVSTILTFWYAYAITQAMLQKTLNGAINLDAVE